MQTATVPSSLMMAVTGVIAEIWGIPAYEMDSSWKIEEDDIPAIRQHLDHQFQVTMAVNLVTNGTVEGMIISVYEAIEAKIFAFVRRQFATDRSVTRDTVFTRDLGADRLDWVDFDFELGQLFKIIVASDDERRTWASDSRLDRLTVGDIVDRVIDKLVERGPLPT